MKGNYVVILLLLLMTATNFCSVVYLNEFCLILKYNNLNWLTKQIYTNQHNASYKYRLNELVLFYRQKKNNTSLCLCIYFQPVKPMLHVLIIYQFKLICSNSNVISIIYIKRRYAQLIFWLLYVCFWYLYSTRAVDYIAYANTQTDTHTHEPTYRNNQTKFNT